MKKTFLMRFDRVDSIYENIKVNKLSFDIKPEVLTLIRTNRKDAVTSLLLGTTLPCGGNIYLAGITITERNANERRVSMIPQEIPTHDIKKLLYDSVNEGIDSPTSFELKRTEKKAERERLHKESKQADADDRKNISAAIKRADIDYTALGLKMQRRKDELELNLKTAKALLTAVSRSPMEQKAVYSEKLQAKIFSAQYELSMFTHKPISDAMLNNRIRTVTKKLNLSASSSDCTLAFSCAFIKAPELAVFCGTPTAAYIAELSELVQKTGIAAVIVTDSKDAFDCENTIDLDDRFFKPCD